MACTTCRPLKSGEERLHELEGEVCKLQREYELKVKLFRRRSANGEMTKYDCYADTPDYQEWVRMKQARERQLIEYKQRLLQKYSTLASCKECKHVLCIMRDSINESSKLLDKVGEKHDEDTSTRATPEQLQAGPTLATENLTNISSRSNSLPRGSEGRVKLRFGSQSFGAADKQKPRVRRFTKVSETFDATHRPDRTSDPDARMCDGSKQSVSMQVSDVSEYKQKRYKVTKKSVKKPANNDDMRLSVDKDGNICEQVEYCTDTEISVQTCTEYATDDDIPGNRQLYGSSNSNELVSTATECDETKNNDTREQQVTNHANQQGCECEQNTKEHNNDLIGSASAMATSNVFASQSSVAYQKTSYDEVFADTSESNNCKQVSTDTSNVISSRSTDEIGSELSHLTSHQQAGYRVTVKHVPEKSENKCDAINLRADRDGNMYEVYESSTDYEIEITTCAEDVPDKLTGRECKNASNVKCQYSLIRDKETDYRKKNSKNTRDLMISRDVDSTLNSSDVGGSGNTLRTTSSCDNLRDSSHSSEGLDDVSYYNKLNKWASIRREKRSSLMSSSPSDIENRKTVLCDRRNRNTMQETKINEDHSKSWLLASEDRKQADNTHGVDQQTQTIAVMNQQWADEEQPTLDTASDDNVLEQILECAPSTESLSDEIVNTEKTAENVKKKKSKLRRLKKLLPTKKRKEGTSDTCNGSSEDKLRAENTELKNENVEQKAEIKALKEKLVQADAIIQKYKHDQRRVHKMNKKLQKAHEESGRVIRQLPTAKPKLEFKKGSFAAKLLSKLPLILEKINIERVAMGLFAMRLITAAQWDDFKRSRGDTEAQKCQFAMCIQNVDDRDAGKVETALRQAGYEELAESILSDSE